MQRTTAGERLTTYGIGVGCGLAAGLVGVAQLVVTVCDLAAQQVAYQAVQQRLPDFFDFKPFVTSNQWFWFGTAAVAVIVILALCMLAAFTTCWARPRKQDGVMAGWVAAIVGSVIHVVATLVVIVTGQDAYIGDFLVPCGVPLGLVFFGTLIPLLPLGASMGIRARGFFSRGRRAL